MGRARMLVALLVAACGDDSGAMPDAALADAKPIDVDAAVRTISGTSSMRHVSDTGSVATPDDLSTHTFEAIDIPSFVTHAGAGKPDGTFTIPGVHDGAYFLRYDSIYIEETASMIDLSTDVLGRSTATVPSAASTLSLSVSSLQGWASTDAVQMVSSNAGLVALDMETVLAPATGATSLTGTYDLRAATQPVLVDTGAGDQVILTQLTTLVDGTTSYQAVARSFAPTTVSVANGGTASVTGTFATPALATIALTWDRGAFDAMLRRDWSSDSPYGLSLFDLAALPRAAELGLYSAAPDVFSVTPGYTTDTTSVVTSSWQLRDPFPAGWTRVLFAAYQIYRYIPVPGASALPVFAYAQTFVDRDTVTSPVGPLLSPVLDAAVNGSSAYADVMGVGLTPTVSWTPPLLGQASSYRVTIYRISIVSGTARSSFVATVMTTHTSLVIPPGLLTAGEMYTLQITAESQPGIDPLATPLKLGLPDALSSISTHLVIP